MLFPMQKLIFGDSGAVPFSHGRNLMGLLLGKMVLADQVCFCLTGFIRFDAIGEKPCAEDH